MRQIKLLGKKKKLIVEILRQVYIAMFPNIRNIRQQWLSVSVNCGISELLILVKLMIIEKGRLVNTVIFLIL